MDIKEKLEKMTESMNEKDVEIQSMKESMTAKDTEISQLKSENEKLKVENEKMQESIAGKVSIGEDEILVKRADYIGGLVKNNAEIPEKMQESIIARVSGKTAEEIAGNIAKEIDYIKNLKESIKVEKPKAGGEKPAAGVGTTEKSIYSGIASKEMIEKINGGK